MGSTAKMFLLISETKEKFQMKLYAGIDLHSSNNYTVIIDEKDKRHFEKRLPNHKPRILSEFSKYKEDLEGLAVESTYNWYWLGDLLYDNGYKVHLANPALMTNYAGIKHTDDEYDAFWMAHMLRLGILPEGYIHSREHRIIRDLLRDRKKLVQQRTACVLTLKNKVILYTGVDLYPDGIKKGRSRRKINRLFEESELLQLSAESYFDTIEVLNKKIKKIEKQIEKNLELKDSYERLLSVPGIGKILASTIMLETGNIDRFKSPKNYSSYCRLVPAKGYSNKKKKKDNNEKSGNKYLAWAYSQAVIHGKKKEKKLQSWFDRKVSRTCKPVGYQALANKYSKACYWIMKKGEEFDIDRMV